MKYALVNGERKEAEPGLSGLCPGCNAKMVARCGKVKVHHWAHASKFLCDPWWENETVWHRAEKSIYPSNWQEVVQFDEESGEKHIADVKTASGYVLELQHSAISIEERDARERFYGKMVWVVNGMRRKKDQPRLLRSLMGVAAINNNPFLSGVFSVSGDAGALLRDWGTSRAPVFIDFGPRVDMWCILPSKESSEKFVVRFSRGCLAHLMLDTSGRDRFMELMVLIVQLTTRYANRPKSGRIGLGGQVNDINNLCRQMIQDYRRSKVGQFLHPQGVDEVSP